MSRALPVTEAETEAFRRRLPRAFGRPARERALLAVGWTVFALLVVYTLVAFDFSPARLWTGLTRFGHVLSFMFPPYVWESWERFMEPVQAIGETLAMAFLGTLGASLMALPLGFLGAKNVMQVEWARFGIRRGFDVLRALEQLILALIFIRAFGLGPLAGIFAIAISDSGSLSKLFAEAIENIDRRPIEGLRASGANTLQVIRLAIIPQVLPVMLSQILYFLESNTRSATILGIVGAGGIGFLLGDRIGANNWPEVMSIVILILITVAAMDWVSRTLRAKAIGTEVYRP